MQAGRAYAYCMAPMNILMLLALSGFLQAGTPDVPYPPNAATGGTVVASVSGSAAGTQVRVLSGEEPFVSAARSALSQWQLPDEGQRRLVVVKFRQPGLFAVGSPSQAIPAPARAVGAIPYPRTVTEPAYPPNASGEGSVVLRVGLASSGEVEKIETVKGLGELTDSGVDAVKGWAFEPAKDSGGRPVASEAYVVFVFRSPVLSPSSRPR